MAPHVVILDAPAVASRDAWIRPPDVLSKMSPVKTKKTRPRQSGSPPPLRLSKSTALVKAPPVVPQAPPEEKETPTDKQEQVPDLPTEASWKVWKVWTIRDFDRTLFERPNIKVWKVWKLRSDVYY